MVKSNDLINGKTCSLILNKIRTIERKMTECDRKEKDLSSEQLVLPGALQKPKTVDAVVPCTGHQVPLQLSN